MALAKRMLTGAAPVLALAACSGKDSAPAAGSASVGAECVPMADGLRPVGVLFGEAQGRVVVSCAPEATEAVLQIARRHEVPARGIGTVRPAADGFAVELPAARVSASLAELSSAYFGAIAAIMDTPPGDR